MLVDNSRVILECDLPASSLTAGDVGTVVFIHEKGKAYEVGFVDGGGSTIALVTLCPDEILDGWITAQGLKATPDLWEVYLSGPESSSDPTTFRTQLNRPLVK